MSKFVIGVAMLVSLFSATFALVVYAIWVKSPALAVLMLVFWALVAVAFWLIEHD